MTGFTREAGVAAPLPIDNIDTDMLCPAQFLYTINKTGLGEFLFHEMRRKADGSLVPDFVLNREPYRKATIIVAGENFGSGSSREHAAWALTDFGIRCVIARSFADIFYMNALKNGILLVSLEQPQIDVLMKDAANAANPVLTVDLAAQKITRANGESIGFSIDPFRRDYLLNGLTDVGELDKMRSDIQSYEARQRAAKPWLFETA
jgi:3-isopropylmalate/(R)-2-methylmalate dehydratase small subunit